MTESNPRELTHITYGLRRETRISGRYLEIGEARFEIDTAKLPPHLKPLIPHLPELFGLIRSHVFLDRTILGSFSGHLYISSRNEVKPIFKPPPQRPAQGSEIASDEHEES